MIHHPRTLVLGACTAAAALLAAGCIEDGAKGAENSSAPVKITTAQPPSRAVADNAWVEVKSATLREYAPAVGTLRARQVTHVGPLVSGRVAQVTVDVGDRVIAGQVLVQLEESLFEIELQQQAAGVDAARGALAGAQADATYWMTELTRQQELFARGVGSQKELGDTQTRQKQTAAVLEEAAGQLAQAEQALAYSRQRLAETAIRAPYAGVVSQRMVDPGDMAAAQPPTDLLEIRETDVLYLEFSLPQELLGLVTVGSPLAFTVEGVGGDAVHTQVDVIFPAVEESTRSFRCRAVVQNTNQRFLPGALARVEVVEQEVADALVIPREALRPTSKGWEVLVAADGKPTPRAVKVGMLTDTEAQVLEGLAPGEK